MHLCVSVIVVYTDDAINYCRICSKSDLLDINRKCVITLNNACQNKKVCQVFLELLDRT